MEEVVLLKDRFNALLEKEGMGSERLAGELVAVVRDLAQSIRDEEDDDEDTDFKKAWDAGWENALDCLIAYCRVETDSTE